MKIKFLLPIIFAIVVGSLLGSVFFKEYDKNTLSIFNEKESIYFVQLGVYNTVESINENVKNNDYIKEKELDGYHIYVGITKNEKIAEKIKVYYESLGNNVYVKQRKIDKKDFLNILEEYDKIIEITTSDKDLISIEHIVLSNYEEMVLQSESYD